MSGLLELEKANVRWFLSLEKEDLPLAAVNRGMRTFRSLTIDGTEFNFSNGFTNLHTKVYNSILRGRGYGLEETKQSINIVYKIRNAHVQKELEYAHPSMIKHSKKSTQIVQDRARLYE